MHTLTLNRIFGDFAIDGKNKRSQKFLNKAEGLKQKALESAQKGDYDKAVENFEASTRQIIQAIRSSGLYIPG